MHVFLLDTNKIMQFIVDVTNTCDKECLMDVTKVTITDKTILTKSELETVQTQYVYPWCKIIMYIVFHIRMYSMQTLNIIQMNSNGFVNRVLPI